MYKYLYFRILIGEKLTTRECLTQLHCIQLAMEHMFKMTRAVHGMSNVFFKINIILFLFYFIIIVIFIIFYHNSILL